MPHIIRQSKAPKIIWTQPAYTGSIPRFLVQRRMMRCPVTNFISTYAAPESTSGIYSVAEYFLNPTTLVSTHIGGTDSPNHSGVENYPASTVNGWNNGEDWTPSGPGPSDRHPDFQTAMDPVNLRKWQFSGLAFGNPGSGDGICYNDLWSLSLNADPTTNVYTNRTSEMANTPGAAFNGTLVNVPSLNLLWYLCPVGGQPRVYVYALSATLTTAQTAVGCTAPRTWSLVYSHATDPPYPELANCIYHPALHGVVVITWDDTTTHTWFYDLFAKTFADMEATDPPSNAEGTHKEWLTSYIAFGEWAGNIHFHRTTHTQNADTGATGDWFLNPVTRIWTSLQAIGFGPSRLTFKDYSPLVGSRGGVLAHEHLGGLWHGEFGIAG